MMDYSKMSDGELSVRLAYFLKPKFSAVISPYDPSGAQLSWNIFNLVQTTGYFPLRDAGHLFPIIKKHKISLQPVGKTVWAAWIDPGEVVKHRNPLRSAAIVYLMQETANVPANSTGSDIR